MEQLLITAAAILFAPAALGILLVVVLASVGQSVGIRKKYVQVLLKIFEYGRQKIEHKQGFIQDSAEEQTGKELGEDGHAGEEDKKAPSGNGCVQSEESGMHVIEREMPLRASEGIRISNVRSVETMQREFQLTDTMYFCKSGVEAIIEDEVTKCFSSEELPSWNLLSRTNNNYQYLSVRLTVLWGLGVYVRYLFLLPFRIILAVIGIAWLIISTAFIGYLPKNRFKKILNQYVSLMCYRILCRAFSAVITFHN
ncbi:glycerol-3-phosphate acyltransferase 4, partial [Lingula anatina]|uniref:Glycerol-3-phosphate acyltransferase 4 n=1 Tax=Lingula anatina TaxID=7574 RepID=A0A1S3HA99_LINAN